MSALRTAMIRLAASDPELRPLLLPLLKEAASVSQDQRAWFEGTGKYVGWTTYLTDIRYADHDGFAVKGYVRWHYNKSDDAWASFEADLIETRGKMLLLNMRFKSASGGKWPQGKHPMFLEGIALDATKRPDAQRQLRALVEHHFPASRGEYSGSLRVVELSGPVRDFMSDDQGRAVGLYNNMGGKGLKILKPEATADAAEKAARAEAAAYEQRSFPGGMASVSGLVHWTDHGKWSGVLGTGYSFS